MTWICLEREVLPWKYSCPGPMFANDHFRVPGFTFRQVLSLKAYKDSWSQRVYQCPWSITSSKVFRLIFLQPQITAWLHPKLWICKNEWFSSHAVVDPDFARKIDGISEVQWLFILHCACEGGMKFWVNPASSGFAINECWTKYART